MNTLLLSPEQVRAQLEPLSRKQMRALAKSSGVPLTTLWNVRSGVTENPGLATVGKFLPHIPDQQPISQGA